MLAVTILALETALASSVAITIDVLAMANHVCIASGRPPAFDVRLDGPGAFLFRPFLAFPEAVHAAPELLIVPAQGLSKATTYEERLAEEDAGTGPTSSSSQLSMARTSQVLAQGRCWSRAPVSSITDVRPRRGGLRRFSASSSLLSCSIRASWS